MVELDCGLSYVLAAVFASEGLNVITPWDQPFAVCALDPDEALDVLPVVLGEFVAQGEYVQLFCPPLWVGRIGSR